MTNRPGITPRERENENPQKHVVFPSSFHHPSEISKKVRQKKTKKSQSQSKTSTDTLERTVSARTAWVVHFTRRPVEIYSNRGDSEGFAERHPGWTHWLKWPSFARVRTSASSGPSCLMWMSSLLSLTSIISFCYGWSAFRICLFFTSSLIDYLVWWSFH